METLREFLAPKTFNRISYVAVIFWILCGVILLGIFAEMENSDFRCVAESDKLDLVRGKCSEQYEKQYNKSGFPVYGFVIINFFGIGLVCVIYSQVVKSKVDLRLAANRQRDVEGQNNAENPPTGSGLIAAYFCQLLTRLTFGIIFIVIQTQLLYPANFPSDFHCQIARGSDAANASSTGNTTIYDMYECHNQRATKKTFWAKAVSVLNGVFAFLIVIEIIWILSRARNGRTFLEDSQFVKDHLPDHSRGQVGPLPDVEEEPEPQISSEPQRGRPLSEMQEELEPQISSESQRGRALSVVMQETEPQLPSEFITRLKESVLKGTEKPSDLKALFQIQPGEGERNKDLKLDQIYTNLALIPNRAEYDFTGNREEQLKVYPQSKKIVKPISREEIVNGENKKILIVGRPGIGKTLFLTKWIRDWASDRAFKNFDFLFFLKFRKFNSDEKPLSLRDLLSRSEYSETELSDQVWSHVIKNPESVLIFFDGLDEFSRRSRIANESFCDSVEKPMPLSALFYNIVEGNLLPGATVLTTTRPTAVSDVKNLSSSVFRKTIEILGFASEQVKKYVENFATDAVEIVEDVGKKIWEHIKTNMNIFSLCYIPVNCFIICSCLLEVLKFDSEKGSTGVRLPTKMTDIYQTCVKLFFSRHDEHRGEDARREERLPTDVKIKKLAKLAFDGLTQKRLIFGQKEVPNDLADSALFHRLPDSQPNALTYEAQYCFIHLTMQEFLAAKHITETMKGEKLRTFVTDHIKNGEWQLVLQFVAGLLGEQSIDIFTDLLPKTKKEKDESELMHKVSLEGPTVTCWPTDSEKDLALTLLKCIRETNESGSVVQSKLEEIGFNAADFSRCRLAPADCTAVVHLIKCVQQISLINLSNNNIGSLGCVEIVKLFDNTNCQLRGLNLGFNNIDDEGVKQLSNALLNSQLSSLNLMHNNIGDEGVKQLSNALLNSQLSSLNLMGNNIGDEGVKQLSNALVNSQLSSLNLMGNNITDEDVKQLSNALVNSQLSSLYLSVNNIGDEGVKQLSNALVNSQLSSLYLSANNIGDEGVKQLSNALVNNNKLRRLVLGGNFQITYEAKEQIRQANPNCEVI